MVDVSQTGLCARFTNRAKLMKAPKRLLSCSARNILRARLASVQVGDNTRLDLHTLLSKGSHLRLSVMHVLVEPVNVPDAQDWIGTVMDAAYAGVSLLSLPGRGFNDTGLKPFRRVLLLVNPAGGKGKARATVKDIVIPVLEAAGCVVDMRGEPGEGLSSWQRQSTGTTQRKSFAR